MNPKFSLTEGSIPRTLFIFSLLSMLLAIGCYRCGGWREIRLGVATIRAVPAAAA